MAIMVELPPQMVQEGRDYAVLEGVSFDQMLVDCLSREFKRKHEAKMAMEQLEAPNNSTTARCCSGDDLYQYLMNQKGWLPDDYVFDREEANAR